MSTGEREPFDDNFTRFPNWLGAICEKRSLKKSGERGRRVSHACRSTNIMTVRHSQFVITDIEHGLTRPQVNFGDEDTVYEVRKTAMMSNSY